MVAISFFLTGFVFGGSYEQTQKKECEATEQKMTIREVEIEKEVIIDNTKDISWCWIARDELKEELTKTNGDLLFLKTLIEKERTYKDNRINKCAEELDNISKARDNCIIHENKLSEELTNIYNQ